MTSKKSILDSLVTKTNDEIEYVDEFIPTKCAECINSIICSPLLTFASIAKYGIVVDIKQCIFNKKE